MVVSALLGVLCLLMLLTAAIFGSAGAVSIFGFNIFICESSDYDSVPAGSAVIATQCAPYDFESGNLVLYSTDPMNKNAQLSMGYYSDFKMMDGVYYLSLVNGDDTTVISETALIGKAGWCSLFLGEFISFTKTPWGVFVMAVIPCALLLLIDLLRAKSDEKPLPEIIPQVKNPEQEPVKPQILVGSGGDASYKKSGSGGRTPASADSVLFTYGSGKKSAGQQKSPAPLMSDADVLSLLNAPSKKSTPEKPAKPEKEDKPTLPAPVAAKRYIDNTVAAPAEQIQEKPDRSDKPGKSERAERSLFSDREKPAGKSVSKHTAELPDLKKQKNKRSDAFFAQSEAPQIGRGMAGKQASKSIIDLEDALSSAPSRNNKAESGRRSANILASKNRMDLIREEDDPRDRSRYEVDDILAGLEREHKK